MKKILALALSLLISIAIFTGCNNTVNLNYKEKSGYKEYVSDCNTGYENLPYYNCDEAMEISDFARKYFENNKRKIGDYIITDYEDGVCINQYVGRKIADNFTLEVPDEIDGKPVVKIGGYPVDNGDDFLGAFAGNTNFTLKLPSTVKYIGYCTFLYFSGIISEEDMDDFTLVSSIEVNEDNPYYSSYQGALYTKDKKSLLYDPMLEWMYLQVSYTVPDFVEIFEPSNGVADSGSIITIGENVKEINTFIDKGEDGIESIPDIKPNIVVKGKIGSAAEQWAKEQYAEFIAID